MQANFMKYAIQELSPHILKMLKHYGIIATWGYKPHAFSAFNVQFEVKGSVYAMARQRSKTSGSSVSSGAGKSEEVQWYNVRFEPDEIAVIQQEADDLPALCSRLASIFLSGSDFSVRYNPARKNFSAFIIAPPSAADSVRSGISAFGGTYTQALSAVLYKRDLFALSPERYTLSGQSLGIG